MNYEQRRRELYTQYERLDYSYLEIGFRIWISEDPDELTIFAQEAGRIKRQLEQVQQQRNLIEEAVNDKTT